MTDDIRARASGLATVTQLDTRRQSNDVLSSITFVFGGVNYGTVPVRAPYTRGKPIVLYIVPEGGDQGGEVCTGPLDCLVTDEPALAAHLDVAR